MGFTSKNKPPLPQAAISLELAGWSIYRGPVSTAVSSSETSKTRRVKGIRGGPCVRTACFGCSPPEWDRYRRAFVARSSSACAPRAFSMQMLLDAAYIMLKNTNEWIRWVSIRMHWRGGERGSLLGSRCFEQVVDRCTRFNFTENI